MALCGWETELIAGLVAEIRQSKHDDEPVRCLMLGYPDFLMSRQEFQEILGDAACALVNRADAAKVAASHNHPKFSEFVATAESVFEAIGVEATTVDFHSSADGVRIVDLNEPLPQEMTGKFDLVIDPGTIEHCFNIAQAVKNVSEAIVVGGFVFHQMAMAFVNHGFYSISPTFVYDFYEKNGYDVRGVWFGLPRSDGAADSPLSRVHLQDLPRVKEGEVPPTYPWIMRSIVQKTEQRAITWPIQRKYGGP